MPTWSLVWLLSLLLGVLPCAAATGGDLAAATTAWATLLTSYVRPNGGVDYAGLAKDPAALTAVLEPYATLSVADCRAVGEAGKKALLINLYNAGMLHNLLRYARSAALAPASPEFLRLKINDISVPGGNIWNGSLTVRLAGVDVTLDAIEHGLLRGAAEVDSRLRGCQVEVLDPRVHAAVNCAAVSCPRLRERPYTAVDVEQMLDDNMREWLSSEEHFAKLDADSMRANQIVAWYYDDFDAQGGAGNYLAKFLQQSAKDRAWKEQHLKQHFNERSMLALKLSSAFSFHYDWRVDDVRNKP